MNRNKGDTERDRYVSYEDVHRESKRRAWKAEAVRASFCCVCEEFVVGVVLGSFMAEEN